jgi:AcrR family transcriptional regulator
MPASFRWTVVSRESVSDIRRICQYVHATSMSDQKRTYRKTRRADLEGQTRMRITESAASLHEELGHARTSISAVAERAGVRRSTVYRHFPDDEALFAACSSHFQAANPPPDLGTWAGMENPAERTETALRELYAFYARTERMYTSLLRDEPLVPIVHRRLGDFYGYLRAVEDSLMAGRGLRGRAARRTRAALGHALAFPTWRSLTREQGLGDGEVVALMSVLAEGAATAG